jgi:WD40 repeat protein
MRVFDWESGNIVGRISGLPKAIMCGAVANNSENFMIGSSDSKVRIFDIAKQPMH